MTVPKSPRMREPSMPDRDDSTSSTPVSPLPPKMTRQIVVRVPEDLYEQLRDDAEKNGRTVAQSVRHILRERLTTFIPWTTPNPYTVPFTPLPIQPWTPPPWQNPTITYTIDTATTDGKPPMADPSLRQFGQRAVNGSAAGHAGASSATTAEAGHDRS